MGLVDARVQVDVLLRAEALLVLFLEDVAELDDALLLGRGGCEGRGGSDRGARVGFPRARPVGKSTRESEKGNARATRGRGRDATRVGVDVEGATRLHELPSLLERDDLPVVDHRVLTRLARGARARVPAVVPRWLQILVRVATSERADHAPAPGNSGGREGGARRRNAPESGDVHLASARVARGVERGAILRGDNKRANVPRRFFHRTRG